MLELHGRRVIYTDTDEITDENILAVLKDAFAVHETNRAEIQYLYDYYKGKQPILERTKEFRQEICNKIVENRANEIVSFKVGYLMGEPVQYVNRGSNEKAISDDINTLNSFVFAEDKAAKDKELADWFTICGTAYRMVLPDPNGEEDESPFEIYTLDPRCSFVVYHSGLGNKPVLGVKYIKRTSDEKTICSVYTKNMYYEIESDSVDPSDGRIIAKKSHMLGDVPIIEYPANSARLGAFEIVIPLLDALNNMSSCRMDGIEQFIQSLLVLKGVDIDSNDWSLIQALGGLKLPPDGDAKYITQELNQEQSQSFVNYLYQTVLVICGMPNRNGGYSTSDTGSAVIMRDGWSDAEARAKDTELMFKMSEKRFLKLALRMISVLRNINLKLSNIDIRFTRRNYENIQTKSQVLTTMLANDKIHPRLAFEHCGMFSDPNLAYSESTEYAAKIMAKQLRELNAIANENEDDELQANG